ncbi:hypothetical protein H5410_037240 [Solanum commersonii]|uniref:Uncharacterized protein n=1 Tax=Solanum commersonii TaxID=4109 RepID=A0A9J5Y8Y1_SOLCO|nr:hypothetical protein H5410_037240 [Solanum commersonii]
MELLVENLVFFDEINAAIETIDYTPNYLLYYMDIRNNRLFEGDKNLSTNKCLLISTTDETSKHLIEDFHFDAMLRAELKQLFSISLPARELKITVEMIRRKNLK